MLLSDIVLYEHQAHVDVELEESAAWMVNLPQQAGVSAAALAVRSRAASMLG